MLIFILFIISFNIQFLSASYPQEQLSLSYKAKILGIDYKVNLYFGSEKKYYFSC